MEHARRATDRSSESGVPARLSTASDWLTATTNVASSELVRGREALYFGHQFATKAGKPLPERAVRYYVAVLASGPEALRCSFEFYRALDATTAQNEERRKGRLALPVLAIGGETNLGAAVGATMRLAADDVETVVLPGSGHYPAEEPPEEMLSALRPFLAPYKATGHPHA
ncbi:alpha/beta fold hydrolase [Streptomyces flaveolus]|uniref:alpha/beta fold hydrolase n=1 Tax=Streptomyces flaveolus TaxID=67297 RepID=UPI0036874854